jgi:hypothetical protein
MTRTRARIRTPSRWIEKVINRRELAICKRRGHEGFPSEGWKQCKWCKTWLREVRKIEEREDEPPEEDLDPLVKSQRRMNQINSSLVDTKMNIEIVKRHVKGRPAPPSKKARGKRK